MSFTPLTPPVPRSLAPAVRLSAQELKTGDVNLTLSMHLDILGMAGQATDAFSIELGGGTDSGFLRIVKNPTGLFKPRVLKGTAIFRLGSTSFGPDGKQKKTELRWTQAGRALRIKLPAWCAVDAE